MPKMRGGRMDESLVSALYEMGDWRRGRGVAEEGSVGVVAIGLDVSPGLRRVDNGEADNRKRKEIE